MITRQLSRPLIASLSKQWICPSCSVSITTTTSSQTSTQPSSPTISQRRSIWTRPRLTNDDEFAVNGVTGLFTKFGYELGWVQYQDHIIRKLNLLAGGTKLEGKDVKDLAVRFAHDPKRASSFNHASMAHNNHFFWLQFSTLPRKLDQFPDLRESLANQFGSIDSLKETFLNTAEAMFGPGFVWLVWTRDPENMSSVRDGSWKILSTYNAGTPYPEAGFMQQGLDMNTNNEESYKTYKQSLGAFGAHTSSAKEKAKLPPGGTSVMPVLCVSVWEHTFIYDFGLGSKAEYLEAFWDVIDWQVVNIRAPKELGSRLRR